MTNLILNGTAAVLLQQSTAAGFSLQNNGAGTLYLGNDASVTPGTGYAVAVGVALPLNAGAVLYGCTDQGTTASVSLLHGASATQATVVEANVPGAISVNGSVEVTNASIPVTGSVDITSGTVDINSGTVNVGGNVATRSGSVPTLIGTVAYPFTTSNTTGPGGFESVYTPGVVDVSAFTTLIISITDGYHSPTVDPTNLGSYISVDINPLDAGSFDFAPIHAEYLLDTIMENAIRVPVTTATVEVIVKLKKNASAVGGSITVALYGSSQTLTDIVYVSQSYYLKGSIASGGVYNRTQSAIATNSDYISSKNGDAAVQIYGAGSVANCVAYAVSGGTIIGLGALYLSTSPVVNGASARMKFPLLPIRIDTALSSGAVLSSVVQ